MQKLHKPGENSKATLNRQTKRRTPETTETPKRQSKPKRTKRAK